MSDDWAFGFDPRGSVKGLRYQPSIQTMLRSLGVTIEDAQTRPGLYRIVNGSDRPLVVSWLEGHGFNIPPHGWVEPHSYGSLNVKAFQPIQ